MQRAGSWEYGSEFPEDSPYEDEAGGANIKMKARR